MAAALAVPSMANPSAEPRAPKPKLAGPNPKALALPAKRAIIASTLTTVTNFLAFISRLLFILYKPQLTLRLY
jgi:uncharacterized RDD family membrane protein YckC